MVSAQDSNGLIANSVTPQFTTKSLILTSCAVKVRNNMAEAKQGDGSTLNAIKSAFTTASEDSNTLTGTNRSASPTSTSKGVKRHSTFKIVPKRESMVLHDVGYEHGWIRKAGEKDDMATEGEGWRSSAYVSIPSPASDKRD